MLARQVLKNASMATLQVIVTGVALFILYHFLLKTIGVERLGVWSVVLATCSLVQLGNLGLSGSVVKFVAKYVARLEPVVAAQVIETAALTLGGVFLFLLVLLYPVLAMLLELGLPPTALGDADLLLPFALISLWISVVGGVFQSGLDGCQRIDLRSALVAVGSIIYLLSVVVFVRMYGFIGLGYAQVLHSAFLLIAGWTLLRSALGALPVFPYRWSGILFKEMLWYGVNFQVGSIAIMLFDPATKWLMTLFSGLAQTGYYEMASRMVSQFRAALVAANQVMVPLIASYEETDPKQGALVYAKALRLIIFLALPYYAAILTTVPLISELWIGRYQEQFVAFSMLLIASAFLNTLIAPAYFSYLGIGRLRWNMLAHITMGVLNVVLGVILGRLYGGLGVALASALAMVLGSSIVIVAYHIEEHIAWREIRTAENRWLVSASVVGILIGLLIYFHLQATESVLTMAIFISAAFSLSVLPTVWFHPMRTEVKVWIRRV